MKRCVYFVGCSLIFVLAGCTGLMPVQPTATPTPILRSPPEMPLAGLDSAQLDLAESALQAALKLYDEGDLPGSEQAAIQAGRILYAADSPVADDQTQRYAALTSKLSLLRVRLNRFLYDVSPELESERFTMPIPYNPRIERQIDYYLTRGRDEFARWLRRSGRYVPTLRQFFIQEDLPADLVYLALVESGFNPRNRSHKSAVGLFQFIKGTAEMVGLKADSWVDERRDPEKAALAAIRHLKSLYKEFDDWDLALAAYNAGSSRVWKSIHAQGKKNYWSLALPPETEAYVPKFYATLIIAREPELYGFNPELEGGHEVAEVEVPGGVDLKVVAQCAGVTLSAVADLNPELTQGCTPPGPETYLLRLPANRAEAFHKAFAALSDAERFLSAEELNRRKFSGVYVVYQVRPGDSLYTIARKHHTTISNIARWNASLSAKKYIHPGQKLRIYRLR